MSKLTDEIKPAKRLSSEDWQIVRCAVLDRDNYRCKKCGRPGREVDHIKPKKLGGTDDLSNLQTLCSNCHTKKTKKDVETIRRMRIVEAYGG